MMLKSNSQRNTLFTTILADGGRIIIRIFAVVALLVVIAHYATTVGFPYPLDYGEGPLLDQAIRLAGGENIYRPSLQSPPFTIANYPPLYVAVVALLVKLFGPSLLIGRLLSLLSTLVTATLLALIVRHESNDRLAMFATVAFFLAGPFVAKWSVLFRIDMLALALSTAALYSVLRFRDDRRGILITGPLLIAAIYTRQSYALAAPLASFIWLLKANRKRAFQLAAFVGGGSLLSFFALNMLTGGGFYLNVVRANVNEYSLSLLYYWTQQLSNNYLILLIVVVVFALTASKTVVAYPLLVSYLLASFLSALTIGKIGSNANYLLELSAALSLIAGISLVWLRQYPWRYPALLLILTFQLGRLINGTLIDAVGSSVSRRNDEPALSQLDELIAESPDPVLADEYMGLITAQGRSLYLQPFEVTQLSRDGAWDQSPLLRSIESQEFPLILVYHSPFWPLHEERWTEEMLAAIEANYRPSQTLAGNVVYRPGSVTGGSTTFAPARNAAFEPDELVLSDPQRLGESGFVTQPYIAVNPASPQHLAAVWSSSSERDCAPPDCETELKLFVSTDGGQNWHEEQPFSGSQAVPWQGMAAYAGNDTLIALGVRSGIPVLNWSDAAGDYEMNVADTRDTRTSRNPSKPWLSVDLDEGRTYLSYVGQDRDNQSVRLNISEDQGHTWSTSIGVDMGAPETDIEAGRAIAPVDAQVLIGQEGRLAVVWRWQPGFWSWPLGVWMASSDDGGETFSPSRRIAETWGPINSASHDERFYILYRIGDQEEQELALAISDDQGASWEAFVVSGDVRLAADFDKIGGIGVAPDGTLDIVFHAQSPGSLDCALDQEQWLRSFFEGYLDNCSYDVYYTFSQDGGESFSIPMKLNAAPIRGDRFVQINNRSSPFTHLSVASTDGYAYPAWIETLADGRSQVTTMQISR